MKGRKKKISSLLLERAMVNSEGKAIALIMEGRIKVKGSIIKKPGTFINPNSKIEIIPKIPYVSRGGIKLEKVFRDLNLSVDGKKAIDIGASTGGFTDFLIKSNASKVIAIDVGYGKLSWKLRKDPNVIVFEKTNVRYLDTEKLPFLSNFTVVDVSFISIKKIFKKILEVTEKGGEILLLVKPQFELKRSEIENKGVIKNKNLHYKVLLDMVKFIGDYPVEIKSINFSKIKGAKGNIEYWIYLLKSFKKEKIDLNYDKIIMETVESSHVYFSKKDTPQ